MSDYLWDKTGEPEADVARLEALLGRFGHEPRPLDLAAEAAPPVRRPSRLSRLFDFPHGLAAERHFRPGRFFAAPRLFAAAGLAAAALLLASLLGVAAYLRARVATEVDHAAAPAGGTRQPTAAARQEAPNPPRAHAPRRGETGAPAGGMKVGTTAVESLPRGPLRAGRVKSASAAGTRRQGRAHANDSGTQPAGAGALEAMRAGGAPSLIENTRLLAKEQLVYALRLTGAKLRDVQQRTQGADASKPAPKERGRTR